MIALAAWRSGRAPVWGVLVLDLAGWAFVLMVQPGTFGLYRGYALLAQWASQAHWAVVFALAAAVCALGSLGGVRAGRMAAAVVGCTAEAAIAVSFAAVPGLSTGVWTHLGVALLGIWLVWREMMGD